MEEERDLKELVENKIPSRERGSIIPKRYPPKNKTSQFNSNTLGVRPPKDEPKLRDKRSIEKEIGSKGKTVNVMGGGSKAKSMIVAAESTNLTEELKYVSPTREISFQFLNKFQELVGEVERQEGSNVLELNSKDINDALLVYLVDYLRRKKLDFQVMKWVKNSISDEGFKVLLSFLVANRTTEVLNVTNNQLTARSLDLIVLFAAKNNLLRTFYLSNNSKVSGFQLKARKGEFERFQIEVVI